MTKKPTAKTATKPATKKAATKPTTKPAPAEAKSTTKSAPAEAKSAVKKAAAVKSTPPTTKPTAKPKKTAAVQPAVAVAPVAEPAAIVEATTITTPAKPSLTVPTSGWTTSVKFKGKRAVTERHANWDAAVTHIMDLLAANETLSKSTKNSLLDYLASGKPEKTTNWHVAGEGVTIEGAGVEPAKEGTPTPAKVTPEPAPQVPAPKSVPAPSEDGEPQSRRAAITRAPRPVPKTNAAPIPAPVAPVAGEPVKDCFITLTRLVPFQYAKEWAAYYEQRMGAPIRIYRNKGPGVVAELVARYDQTNRDPTAPRVSLSYPWHPDHERARDDAPTAAVHQLPTTRAPTRPAPGAATAPQRRTRTPLTTTSTPAPRSRNGGGASPSVQVVAMLCRPNGATMDEMKAVTGWGFGLTYMERLATTHGKTLNDLGNKTWSFT